MLQQNINIVYLSCEGLELQTPVKSRVTSGCWPFGTPSTRLCVMDKAEQIKPMLQALLEQVNQEITMLEALDGTRNRINFHWWTSYM